MKQTGKKLTPLNLSKWLYVIFVIACIAAVIVYGAYFARFGPDSSFSTINGDWGTFGDFIGGTLNPIFSFLGLIALLVTIVIQNNGLELSRKELELTRLELEATRSELRRSAAAQEATQKVMDEQSKTQIKQQFEGTFFALLEQLNNKLKSLQHEAKIHTLLGDIHYRYRSQFMPLIDASFEPGMEYLRMLHVVLELISNYPPSSEDLKSPPTNSIDNHTVSEEENLYINILKAHLNGHSICLIGYYGIFLSSEKPNNRLTSLISRYSLIENIPSIVNIHDKNIAAALRSYYNK